MAKASHGSALARVRFPIPVLLRKKLKHFLFYVFSIVVPQLRCSSIVAQGESAWLIFERIKEPGGLSIETTRCYIGPIVKWLRRGILIVSANMPRLLTTPEAWVRIPVGPYEFETGSDKKFLVHAVLCAYSLVVELRFSTP